MGRLYVLQSWVGAAEDQYNLSSNYSGEQIGNRLSASRELNVSRRGTDRLAPYREQEKGKGKGEPIEYQLYPQQKKLDKLDELEEAARHQFKRGIIDRTHYLELLDGIEKRRATEWASLAKAKGWGCIKEEKELKEGTSTLFLLFYCFLYLLGSVYLFNI